MGITGFFFFSYFKIFHCIGDDQTPVLILEGIVNCMQIWFCKDKKMWDVIVEARTSVL